MNQILKRELQKLDDACFDIDIPLSKVGSLQAFLSASNKRVALAVLGSVVKNLPSEKELPSSLGEEFYKQESVSGYISRIKLAIEQEMGRWV